MGRIVYIKGDLFSSNADYLVNAVNTVGVMGKGIAKSFKEKYPATNDTYVSVCQNHNFDIGHLIVTREKGKGIILFPTKKHWRNPSKLEYIEAGLRKLCDLSFVLNGNAMAFPKLGCGNGGLNWKDVQPLMERYLKYIPMISYVYTDSSDALIPRQVIINDLQKWDIESRDLCGYDELKYLLNINKDEANSKLDDAEFDVKMSGLWTWIRQNGSFEISDLPGEYMEESDYLVDKLNENGFLYPIELSLCGREDTYHPGYQYVGF